MQSLGAKTIALALPAWVIAAYDTDGKPNAMAAAWTGICCSNPPQAYFSATAARYTHACVKASKAFTVNIPGKEQAKITDYLGIASGRSTDKFSAAGLEAVRSELVAAPYIKGFPVVMDCQVVKEIELGSHTMFIGEIKDVKVDEQWLTAESKLDIERIQPFIYCTANSTYYEAAIPMGKGYSIGQEISGQVD